MQFRRFKTLKVVASDFLPLPGGGFLGRLRDADATFLLANTPTLNTQENAAFETFLASEMLMVPGEFDESTFLVTVHELKEYISVKAHFRSREQSLQFIDVVDDDYVGHDINDLRGNYSDVSLFIIDPSSVYLDVDISSIAASALASTSALRSPIFDRETGDAVAELIGRAGCSTDNIFQALTASQWRHAFLDVYRCLESLFFFPWMRDLSNRIGSTTSYRELRDECRSQLGWNARELQSLSKLFECTNDIELRKIERSIECFKDLLSNADAGRASYAERVYFARNSLVHHEDREHHDKQPPAPSDYKFLTLYLARFLYHFDKLHGPDLTGGSP